MAFYLLQGRVGQGANHINLSAERQQKRKHKYVWHKQEPQRLQCNNPPGLLHCTSWPIYCFAVKLYSLFTCLTLSDFIFSVNFQIFSDSHFTQVLSTILLAKLSQNVILMRGLFFSVEEARPGTEKSCSHNNDKAIN